MYASFLDEEGSYYSSVSVQMSGKFTKGFLRASCRECGGTDVHQRRSDHTSRKPLDLSLPPSLPLLSLSLSLSLSLPLPFPFSPISLYLSVLSLSLCFSPISLSNLFIPLSLSAFLPCCTQHHSFYDFIINKARGKSGPLFSFDVHDDVRLIGDASVEKDEVCKMYCRGIT